MMSAITSNPSISQITTTIQEPPRQPSEISLKDQLLAVTHQFRVWCYGTLQLEHCDIIPL
jgi:hypothetical protein